MWKHSFLLSKNVPLIPSFKKMNQFIKNALTLLNSNRIAEAIKYIRRRLETDKNIKLLDDLNKIESTYGFMLTFLSEGKEDSDRIRIFSNIKEELFTIVRCIETMMEMQVSSSLYYNISRTLNYSNSTFAEALGRFISADAALQFANSDEFDNAEARSLISEKNRALKDIFSIVWTLPINSASTLDDIRQVASNNDIAFDLRGSIVAALMMNLLMVYDRQKLLAMTDIFRRTDSLKLKARALTAILLVIERYPNRVKDDYELALRMDNLIDDDSFYPRLREVIYALVKARGGIKLLNKIERDLLPEIMKMGPQVMDKLRKSSGTVDLSEISENPDWNKLMSGKVESKLRKLNDLQASGGDVMLSMFAQLHDKFYFFNDIDVWFRPFEDWEYVNLGLDSKFSEMISRIPLGTMLCDSDRYAFILNISRMPESTRNVMLSAFTTQQEQMNEEMKEMLLKVNELDFRTEAENYAKVIFRFFNYFRLKSEFHNPFNHPLDIFNLPFLGILARRDDEMPEILSDYYFQQEFYEDAINSLTQLMKRDLTNEKIYLQKIGFCFEKTGDMENALSYYLRSRDSLWGDLSSEENDDKLLKSEEWLYKKIFKVSLAVGNIQEALKSIERLMKDFPDDIDYLKKYLSLRIDNKEVRNIGSSIDDLILKLKYLSPDDSGVADIAARWRIITGRYKEALEEVSTLLDQVSMYLAEVALKDAVDNSSAASLITDGVSTGGSGSESGNSSIEDLRKEESEFAEILVISIVANLGLKRYKEVINGIKDILMLKNLGKRPLEIRHYIENRGRLLEIKEESLSVFPICFDAARRKSL